MTMSIIYREEYMKRLIYLRDKRIIKVLTGIRRAGKSTILKQFQNYLIEDGVEKENIIYLNLDDSNHRDLLQEDVLHNYILERVDSKKMNYVFLDEIQNVELFQKCVNSLFLRNYIDLYITGSNSYMLSSDLATYLTGRYMEIHVMPLSFKEYVSYYGQTDELKKYNDYITYGGFPYLIHLDDKTEKIHYLDSIYHTVVMKDVIYRKKVKDPMLLESMNRFLFDSIGSSISTKKISDTMASDGRKNSVHTIEEYLNSLLESFILYKVNRFDIKGKGLLKTQKKYYLSDLGLRTYLLGNSKGKDMGHILENVIFLEFKRRGYQIYVGKKDQMEVDFVLEKEDDLIYVQVSLSVREEQTLERELKPLRSIQDYHKRYLMTLDYDTNNYDGIKQISAIDFLLGRVDL